MTTQSQLHQQLHQPLTLQQTVPCAKTLVPCAKTLVSCAETLVSCAKMRVSCVKLTRLINKLLFLIENIIARQLFALEVTLITTQTVYLFKQKTGSIIRHVKENQCCNIS